MTTGSGQEFPQISLRSNWLTVDRNTLRADVLKDSRNERTTISAEELEAILLLGRTSILNGIEDFYDEQRAKTPDLTVVRPSIWTAQLGNTRQTEGVNSKVFTKQGYDNGGVLTSFREVRENFHGYWDAVEQAGFLPEVRRTSGGRDGGSWLLLRKPSLTQVMQHWFDIPGDRIIEYIASRNATEQVGVLATLQTLTERDIDRLPDAMRSRRQILHILSTAAIKSTLGDIEGYEIEVDNALTYAAGDGNIDDSTIRAIENSTFSRDI